MKKEKAIATIEKMPEEFDLEELIERLIVINKIEKGLKDSEEGKVVPHDQVKEMIKKW